MTIVPNCSMGYWIRDTEGEGKLTSTLKLVEMGTTATQLRNLFERNNKKNIQLEGKENRN